MNITKLRINTKSKNYPIIIGSKILKNTGVLLKKKFNNTKKVCIITDKNLPSLILKEIKKSLKSYKITIIKLNSGEKIKNIKIANKIINQILKEKFNRTDCIIALGGGVIGDLAGFVSSLVKRGIKFINIPTTLLAQVDASIGGKTAVNSIYGKNLIGTFYQPDLVLADISILRFLPKRQIISGYAEILKHSLILDKKFFLWLDKNGKKIIENQNKIFLKKAIIKSCKIKSFVVNSDETEKNFRMILNFGHTFGHALEAITKFSNKLNHGEAVLLGMLVASKISYKKKLLNLVDLNLIEKHYDKLNLPMKLQNYIKEKQITKIIEFMMSDKKNKNKNINLILLSRIGCAPKQQEISAITLRKFLKYSYE